MLLVVDNLEGALAVVGALIALIALIFAFIQFKDARFHTASLKSLVSDFQTIEETMSGNLNQLSDDLKTVKGELSTKFLSEFPGFINDINTLIDSAKSELVIVCDFPAYCYFSDFGNWLKYHSTINNKIEQGVSVTMVCFAKEQLKERIQAQFLNIENYTAEEAWARSLGNERFQSKLRHFISMHDRELHKQQGQKAYTPEEMPLGKFIELSIAANYTILISEFLGIDILETQAQLSFFCWIADNKTAVFAIPRSETDSKELGFKTSDEKLISALKSIVKSYKATSTPIAR